MARRKATVVNWIRSIGAGSGFRIFIYVLLPSVTLLNMLASAAGPKIFVLILLFGVGIPVAVFGVWLEVKSIARRVCNSHEDSDT